MSTDAERYREIVDLVRKYGFVYSVGDALTIEFTDDVMKTRQLFNLVCGIESDYIFKEEEAPKQECQCSYCKERREKISKISSRIEIERLEEERRNS